MGIIETPLAMAGLPFATLLGAGVPLGVGVPLRLDRSELAWAGGMVDVDGGGVPAPLLRTSWPRDSGFTSMNAMSGPATIALLPRSRALLFNGWSSDVTQIATGPLMSAGTTHWSSAREMEKGAPPTSI